MNQVPWDNLIFSSELRKAEVINEPVSGRSGRYDHFRQLAIQQLQQLDN